MREIEYRRMDHDPVDPNRVKWYALALSFIGVLFAFLTIKTNWDYFAQYYDGFAFWAKVIPFCAVEATIIVLPLFKGLGNKAQGNLSLFCEVVLVIGALTHTYLVSDASIAKIKAGKTKAEANADFDKARAIAQQITATNIRLQENHAKQMRYWNDAAYIARREGKSAPAAPAPPRLQDVPQIDQALLTNATLSVETAADIRVSPQTLQVLLFGLIGWVTGTYLIMFLLADASIIKSWLLKERAREIKTHVMGNPVPMRAPISMAPPSLSTQARSSDQDFQQRNSRPGLLRRVFSRSNRRD